MEVDENVKSVMASCGTTGSVTVSLHPLVIMNISEHWTRIRAQEGQPKQGALIGKQKGRNIEIMNSFELVWIFLDDHIVIDREYYASKEEQFKQVFSDLDFLGWYTTGGAPNQSDIKVHKQSIPSEEDLMRSPQSSEGRICAINESPLFLKMDPLQRNSDVIIYVIFTVIYAQFKLPLTLYESVIDLIDGEATMLFVELTYTLATEEAERIGVDHVARMSASDTGESSLVGEHLQAQHNAVKMLHDRVKLILNYVKAVQNGDLPANHEILREGHSLCHRLPVLNSEKFKGDFFNQCNDVGLMTYLGNITKGCNSTNQFVNKFNILHDRQGLGRRLRGLFF
ncbi:COP9 signalosome complex subunit 6 [Nymphon striatum]|nr:COP9 signalosome complex subunit 6 [Nymphon striatum]